MSSSERFSRQADIIPRGRLLACAVTVIGVGAIGRQVAIQLSAMGVGHLQLVDFDHVEASNLASQGYAERDLGRSKVAASADACRALNTNVELIQIPHRFRRSLDTGSVIFCCVERACASLALAEDRRSVPLQCTGILRKSRSSPVWEPLPGACPEEAAGSRPHSCRTQVPPMKRP